VEENNEAFGCSKLLLNTNYQILIHRIQILYFTFSDNQLNKQGWVAISHTAIPTMMPAAPASSCGWITPLRMKL
jgi:hypothetical protein